jgi:hypothetical protein
MAMGQRATSGRTSPTFESDHVAATHDGKEVSRRRSPAFIYIPAATTFLSTKAPSRPRATTTTTNHTEHIACYHRTHQAIKNGVQRWQHCSVE